MTAYPASQPMRPTLQELHRQSVLYYRLLDALEHQALVVRGLQEALGFGEVLEAMEHAEVLAQVPRPGRN